MEKKCFVALLMVVVMMCACWTGVLAENLERETFTSGDYEYALLDDGTIEITKYNGSADHLAIPATLDGKTVTAIGDYAFAHCYSLISVSIPDSVTSIGDGAFYSCSSLTSVSIPDSVTAIGDSAFGCCSSLTSVSIPDSVTAIESWAFYACSSLTSVSIPNSVTAIGDYAFSDCPNLTLTVPRSSYAAEYAKTNNIPYTYPDANDWLNN